jgi:hypothetical protein
LVDPNPDVLAHASRRLAHLNPLVVEADVCKPLVNLVGGHRYDSVALNLVLHCLPGPMLNKARAIGHVAGILEPDGVLFGSTVIGSPEVNTVVSRPVVRLYNRLRAFDNLSDSVQGLREILSASFEAVELEIVGSIAIFSATKPRLVPVNESVPGSVEIEGRNANSLRS